MPPGSTKPLARLRFSGDRQVGGEKYKRIKVASLLAIIIGAVFALAFQAAHDPSILAPILGQGAADALQNSVNNYGSPKAWLGELGSIFVLYSDNAAIVTAMTLASLGAANSRKVMLGAMSISAIYQWVMLIVAGWAASHLASIFGETAVHIMHMSILVFAGMLFLSSVARDLFVNFVLGRTTHEAKHGTFGQVFQKVLMVEIGVNIDTVVQAGRLSSSDMVLSAAIIFGGTAIVLAIFPLVIWLIQRSRLAAMGMTGVIVYSATHLLSDGITGMNIPSIGGVDVTQAAFLTIATACTVFAVWKLELSKSEAKALALAVPMWFISVMRTMADMLEDVFTLDRAGLAKTIPAVIAVAVVAVPAAFASNN